MYLRSSNLWPIGVLSLLSATALAVTTFYAATKRKRWTILLAHLSIFIYWVMDFLLIAAGV
jgi:hypothetical protein